MLRLIYERVLPVDLATAWTLVADPVAMNTWSTARIDSVAVGDDDHPAGVGALRRVHVPHGGVLLEVIEQVDAPRRIAYRVIAGAPVREHRGVLELSEGSGGTQLRWTVEIVPLTRVLSPIIRRLLDRELARSLDRMVAIASAQEARAGILPPHRDPDAGADLVALRRAAVSVAAGQGDLADDLLGRDDPRGWFARVYHHVTTAIIDAVTAGAMDHPAWVYRLVPVFDRYFTDAIAAEPAAVEAHWRHAFDRLARVKAGGATSFVLAMHAVHAGMHAHIQDDLPRTLAHVWLDHYGPRADRDALCKPARFRADYMRMRDVFQRAGNALMAELPRSGWNLRARAIDLLTPEALHGTLIDRHFYPITRERSLAFERGTAMAQLVLARQRRA